VQTDGAAQYRANAARVASESNKRQVADAQSKIASTRVNLVELKKRAASLGWASSPYNRNLPPKSAWNDLPNDVQAELKRVGITLDEFKGQVLPACRISQQEFLGKASQVDTETTTPDELADGIMDFLIASFPKSVFNDSREISK
jgi:hypothetical protein